MLIRRAQCIERIGIDIIGVEIGSEFSILGRVEAVSTGALLTVEIEADATGECVRCLDPITLEIFATVQELFHFEPPADLAEDDDLPLLVTDDQIEAGQLFQLAETAKQLHR